MVLVDTDLQFLAAEQLQRTFAHRQRQRVIERGVRALELVVGPERRRRPRALGANDIIKDIELASGHAVVGGHQFAPGRFNEGRHDEFLRLARVQQLVSVGAIFKLVLARVEDIKEPLAALSLAVVQTFQVSC